MHSINQKIILIFSSIISLLPSFIYSSNKTTDMPLEDKLIILCSDAPNEQLRIFCEQLHKSDIIARKYLEVAALRLEPKSAQECFNFLCICILPNGSHLKKSVRKEFRMLSDKEREKFNKILRIMKETGDYDRFAKQHRRVVVEGGAHSGPAFLLWHREFLKRFEITMRLYDPSISLPYWDSVLDSRIPKSADSYLFSNELFGETDNNQSVINGPYSPWRTLEGNQFITRSVGESGSCLKQKDIDTIMNKNGILNCLGYSTPKDIIHGLVHVFCGGDMLNVSTSANDPIFYYHHCFMDFIWEMWRYKNQNRTERELQYPPDNEECASDDHYANATMEPFNNLVNIDALRNVYTDLLYEYAPRPNCDNITDCGSKYLFCDRSHGRPECVAKIKIGGNCTGFESK
uniref:Tyrosinase copper-binding domain-containing protein n=1 Tax=Meloidogyne enterolobii TaxID=390850 RepID=A0A6V7X6U0_MELEN|nr:unnamed protein product [Meloidogyne enterolobii]